MKYWDTSAIVPLLLEQAATPSVTALLGADKEMVVWWGTAIEVASAAARLRREHRLQLDEEEHALQLLAQLSEAWTEVLPSERLRADAKRLLRLHPLTAADALQLAAARIWSSEPASEFVTFDERLALAARLEGFRIPISAP